MLGNKIVSILTVSTLALGLAACNGNTTDQSLNDGNNQNMTSDTAPYPVRYNQEGNNRYTSNISASTTDITSENYPHTKAVLIQDAKFKYVQVDPSEVEDIQKRLQQEYQPDLQNRWNIQQRQTKTEQNEPEPDQQQQTNQQDPAQQQQTNQQDPAQQQQQPEPQQETPEQQNQAQAGISQYAQQVIDLTNKHRTQAGLPALKADSQLSGVALKKSQDMQANNYFSHTSPTYGSPFDMMRDFGVDYKSAGENIAQGQRSPQEVVTAWMNSPGHKANILSEKFTHIGVGHETAGNHWTQMFISK